jgi:hypothetical protein
MLLKITHATDLRYTDLIAETVMELRMAPRQEQDQHRLSFNRRRRSPAISTGWGIPFMPLTSGRFIIR